MHACTHAYMHAPNQINIYPQPEPPPPSSFPPLSPFCLLPEAPPARVERGAGASHPAGGGGATEGEGDKAAEAAERVAEKGDGKKSGNGTEAGAESEGGP